MYHEDGTLCSFAEDNEKDILTLEERIKKLELLLVDCVNWDNLDQKQYDFVSELHKKYYPENY